jgi:DNA-binding GntR family transcriptional regulator
MVLTAAQPRYLQIARTLISEIESGRYAVGELMPTEHELCQQFGASRFTVREATKRLVELGLISRQAGVGTRVLSTQSQIGYRQVMQGMSDLHQYAAETDLEITDVGMIELDEELAIHVRAPIGQSWLRLRGVRRFASDGGVPICVTEIYIHPAFRAIDQVGGRSAIPVYRRIEDQFGETIVEVQQQIRAVALSREQAEILGARQKTPALWVCRTYLNRRGEVVEVAMSTHPEDRFSYSQTFRRDSRGNKERKDDAS